MYQAPRAERTEARKPSGVKSAWIVAVGSVIPRPLYVLIPGCRLARPGAMTADSWRAKLRNEPFGAGSVTTRGLVRAASVCSRGARARTDFRRSVSSLSERKARAWTATRDPRAGCGLA